MSIAHLGVSTISSRLTIRRWSMMSGQFFDSKSSTSSVFCRRKQKIPRGERQIHRPSGSRSARRHAKRDNNEQRRVLGNGQVRCYRPPRDLGLRLAMLGHCSTAGKNSRGYHPLIVSARAKTELRIKKKQGYERGSMRCRRTWRHRHSEHAKKRAGGRARRPASYHAHSFAITNTSTRVYSSTRPQ